MDSAQFPVSLEDFMKFTYHEELVDSLFKAQSQGIDMLGMNTNSNYSRKQILEKYYESFYLDPEIRNKFPIRFRPMPKKRREMILQVPTLVKTPKNAIAGNVCEKKESNVAESLKRTKHNTECDKGHSMDTNRAQFPVSLEDFMKCSYYEELVDSLLKAQSQGIDMLDMNTNSNYSRKQILEKYYESFYLNPEIRHKFPIRFRPMPKKRREMILQVPTLVKTPKNAIAGNVCEKETNVAESLKRTKHNTECDGGHSMDTNRAQFPVSLEDFMKCSYYEELVDSLLKTQSQGIDMLGMNTNSKYSRKQILEKYYASFYLDPEIRNKFPIRFRPMPKKRREMILQVPTLVKTPKNAVAGNVCEKETNVAESLKRTKHNTECDGGPKPVKRSSENVSQSPDISIPAKRPKIGVPAEAMDLTTGECPYIRPVDSAESNYHNVKLPKNGSGQSCPKNRILKDAAALHNIDVNVRTTGTFEGTVQTQNLKTLNSVQMSRPMDATTKSHGNDKLPEVSSKQPIVPEISSSSTEETNKSDKKVDFSELQKLAHLCPVTLSQFKKYTNVTEVMRKGCEDRYGDPQINLQHVIKLAYWSFYLHPIARYESPWCNIQPNTNCPEILKMKIMEKPKLPSSENDKVNKRPNDIAIGAEVRECINNSAKTSSGCDGIVDNIVAKSRPTETLQPSTNFKRMENSTEYGEERVTTAECNIIPTSAKSVKRSAESVSQLPHTSIPGKRPKISVPAEAMDLTTYIRPVASAEGNYHNVKLPKNGSGQSCPKNRILKDADALRNTDVNVPTTGTFERTVQTQNLKALNSVQMSRPMDATTKSHGNDNLPNLPEVSSIVRSCDMQANTNCPEILKTNILEIPKPHSTENDKINKRRNDIVIGAEVKESINNSTKTSSGCDGIVDNMTKSTTTYPDNAQKRGIVILENRLVTHAYRNPIDSELSVTSPHHSETAGSDKNRTRCKRSVEEVLGTISKSKTWYSHFRLSLLSTTKKRLTALLPMPVSYQLFQNSFNSEHYLKMNLTKFCGQEVGLLEVLLSDTELCNQLQLYFHLQHFSKSKQRAEYPLPLKLSIVLNVEKQQESIFETNLQTSAATIAGQVEAKKNDGNTNDCRLPDAINQRASQSNIGRSVEINEKSASNPQKNESDKLLLTTSKTNAVKLSSALPSESQSPVKLSGTQLKESTKNSETNQLSTNEYVRPVDDSQQSSNVLTPSPKNNTTKPANNVLSPKDQLPSTKDQSPTILKVTTQHKETTEKSLNSPQKQRTTRFLPPANRPLSRNESAPSSNNTQQSSNSSQSVDRFKSQIENTNASKTNSSPRSSGISGERKTVNSSTERAKRVFFQYYTNKYSLPYMLRVSHGVKQRVIEAVSDLSFEDFKEMTHIYRGRDLYTDADTLKLMYKYVFKTQRIWPRNLFIGLEKMCLLLKNKRIAVPEASTVLKYISPRFLHWSNLVKYTNIMDCVSSHYMSRLNEKFDTEDKSKVESECNYYYNQCWMLDRWIGEIPKLKATQSNITILEENTKGLNNPAIQEVSVYEETSDVITMNTTELPLPQIMSSKAASPRKSDSVEARSDGTARVNASSVITDRVGVQLEAAHAEETMYELPLPQKMSPKAASPTKSDSVEARSDGTARVNASSVITDRVGVQLEAAHAEETMYELPLPQTISPKAASPRKSDSVEARSDGTARVNASSVITDRVGVQLEAAHAEETMYELPLPQTMSPKAASPRKSDSVEARSDGTARVNASSVITDRVGVQLEAAHAEETMYELPLPPTMPPKAASPRKSDSVDARSDGMARINSGSDINDRVGVQLEAAHAEETMDISNDAEEEFIYVISDSSDNVMPESDEEFTEVIPDVVIASAVTVAEMSPNAAEKDNTEETSTLANATMTEAKTQSPVPTRLIEVPSYTSVPYSEDAIDFTSPQVEMSCNVDPLQQFLSSDAVDKNSIENYSSDDSSVIFIPDDTIKQESTPLKILRNLKFVLKDDDTIQCSRYIDEVVDLDSSSQTVVSNEDENFPPSQIDFCDNDEAATQGLLTTAPSTTSVDLLSSGSSSFILNFGQRLPSSIDSNEAQYDCQQTAKDPLRAIELIDVNIASSESQSSLHQTPENCPLSNADTNPPEQETCAIQSPSIAPMSLGGESSFGNIQEAQRFPSTLDETLPVATNNERIVAYGNQYKRTQSAVTAKAKQVKSTRLDLVPQKAHALRSLPVMTVIPKSRFKSSAKQNPIEAKSTKASAVAEPIRVVDINKLLLSPQAFVDISSDFVPGPTSTQTLEQPQTLPPPVAAINSQQSLRVSQELLKDNTLFNSTTLLKAVDDNCTKSKVVMPLTVNKPLKVNNITTAAKSCNSLTPPRKKRIILYRNLLQLHYFQSLTSDHISKYQLPTVDYRTSYLEATVSCVNLKTRLSNESVFSLFPQWPSHLRRDVLTVLNDLNEFHFLRFESSPIEDLRSKILHQFFLTISPFCKAQISYEVYNSEFSKCIPLWNSCNCASHLRKPFQSLTHALKPNLLNRLKTLKNDLKNGR